MSLQQHFDGEICKEEKISNLRCKVGEEEMEEEKKPAAKEKKRGVSVEISTETPLYKLGWVELGRDWSRPVENWSRLVETQFRPYISSRLGRDHRDGRDLDPSRSSFRSMFLLPHTPESF